MQPASAAAPGSSAPEAGIRPTNERGEPLNLDFETGTLDDWQATGDAFKGQPIKGDVVHARKPPQTSGHTGNFWIGTYEVQRDAPQGTLTSVPFKVTQPYATFLLAGGRQNTSRAELVRQDTQDVIFRASADDTETLKPVVVDLRAQLGKLISIRLVDQSSAGWGHINFDDFRFLATPPRVPSTGPPPADAFLHAGLSPQQAAKAMTVPPGFSVKLFAGEPDVHQPIAMAIDDRGRLWVAEAYSYPVHVSEEQAKDRILIFEDQDGDGHFDSRKVFTDKLNLVSGLEIGFGGVWVGAAPNFLFIPDADGDDRPDGPPRVLLDGWGFQDSHETLNSFIWGPDGWLYGCHGVFTHSRVGKPGTPDEDRIPINAGIWRYHPTRHAFEVFAQGTSNPWGVDFNDRGQAFLTACVIPHLYHIIQGGRYQRQAGTHFNPATYDDIKTIAIHRHWLGSSPHAGNNRSDSAGGGHAHAGAMIYLGGSWPAQYRDQIFMNNIHGARINEDLLTQQGSGYVGNRAPDFLFANDSWSQILNLQSGPDGQVYMIDWYDNNQCHHKNTDGHDRTNGRIFKVVYQQPQPVHVDLKKLGSPELVKLLRNPNDWYVRHARRILQERKADPAAQQALLAMLTGEKDETRRLRALWALHVCNGLSEDILLRTLDDTSPWLRAWSIQLALDGPAKPLSPAFMNKLARLAKEDASPVVRLYLASAAQRLPFAARWEMLEALVAHSEDAGDDNLPLMDWYAAEPLADLDAARLLKLASQAKIPLLLNYTVRRIGSIGTPAAVELLVEALDRSPPEQQLLFLSGLNDALKAKRQVAMPKTWPEVYSRLNTSSSAEIRNQTVSLAVTFGDAAEIARLRNVLADAKSAAADRQLALTLLMKIGAADLAPTLQNLLATDSLRAPALRALASFDDPRTAAAILDLYPKLNSGDKRDALNTLASRVAYAEALIRAVGDKRIAASDLSADLVRQLRNLKNPALDKQIEAVWGTIHDTPKERAQLISQYRRMLTTPPGAPPEVALGRAVFAKTCQQCHTLFGTGGKVGPELTGSNRANLDYLLSNVVDPSAVIGKDYLAQVIVTSQGRVLTGLVRGEDANSLTLVTANETLVIPLSEIEERAVSDKSMMPEDILKPLSELEIRSLVAYLASPSQVPMKATADNIKSFFNGQDLAGWQGDPELWKVDQGELVGKTPGLKHNEFLRSDLLVGDFRLSMDVKLVGNQGNSGVQFRSESLPGGSVRGYQADIGAGWWGKLYEEHGRALLWNKSGESFVKLGEWNRYEILAVGSKIHTWINGRLCVDLDDPAGARQGIFALQLHSGGPTEVRFRNIQLELNPPSKAAASKP
jgi:putative membrane-bound dehydrogenase-like protein